MNFWWPIVLFSALKAQAGLHRPEGIVKTLFDTKATWMILPKLDYQTIMCILKKDPKSVLVEYKL